MALPASCRLADKQAISYVLKKGSCYKTPFFRAIFLPTAEKSTRIVVIPTKKLSKKAVTRNAIRRKFLESIYICLEDIPNNKRIVIFPYEKSIETSFSEILFQIKKFITWLSKKQNHTHTKKQKT